jgi:anaerobic selenocysteine-containing dehydrogenase
MQHDQTSSAQRPTHLSRRTLLKLGATAAATLPLFHFARVTGAAPSVADVPARPKLRSWSDLHREKWTWDSLARGSHGWVNCRSTCNWDLYVKDGIVVREEQAGNYGASEPGLPDFNPRGCQKGGCYTALMYGPTRLTVPMKRVGERGSGKWQRVSWEQALREIAEKVVDVCVEYGPDSIVQDLGPHFDMGATTVARNRFWSLMGASLPDDWAEIGDLNTGATLTSWPSACTTLKRPSMAGSRPSSESFTRSSFPWQPGAGTAAPCFGSHM